MEVGHVVFPDWPQYTLAFKATNPFFFFFFCLLVPSAVCTCTPDWPTYLSMNTQALFAVWQQDGSSASYN